MSCHSLSIAIGMWSKSIISAVLCLIGCSIQLIDISSRYFKYSTKPNVQIKIIIRLESPSVSICWMIPNTLDHKKVETKFGIRLWSKNGKVDNTKLNKLLTYMTAGEILEMSHSNESLLTDKLACRNQGSWKTCLALSMVRQNRLPQAGENNKIFAPIPGLLQNRKN